MTVARNANTSDDRDVLQIRVATVAKESFLNACGGNRRGSETLRGLMSLYCRAATSNSAQGEPLTMLERLIDDLLAAEKSLAQAQEIVRKYVPDNVSLVDELIADRRAEAARE